METVVPLAPPMGSMLAVDERGVGLRATWRLSHGFINLSVWRDDQCVETFHLTPADAARFVSFLVSGLAQVATVGAAASVSRLPAPAAVGRRVRLRSQAARRQLAGALRTAAERITPR